MFPSWHFRRAAGQLLNECRQLVSRVRRASRRVAPSALSPAGVSTLHELQRTGLCVLPEFVSRERCAELVSRIDAAETRYPAFVQLDEAKADRRLFGLDAVDEEVRRAAFDPRAMDVLEAYQGTREFEGFALCAKLSATPGNLGSGQGWHRDSAARMQTKCMIYLTDVGADDGPFQYVVGSHRPLDVVRSAGRHGFAVNQHRFTEQEVAALFAAAPQRVRTLTAPAGTAILFDARGLHRGAPILRGPRYAITTYLWFDQPAPAHIRAWTIESQLRSGALGVT